MQERMQTTAANTIFASGICYSESSQFETEMLWLVLRADSNSQVRKCFVFCTADFGLGLPMDQLNKNPNIAKIGLPYQLCSYFSPLFEMQSANGLNSTNVNRCEIYINYHYVITLNFPCA